MTNRDLSTEIGHIIILLFIALLGGMLSHQWLLSLSLCLIGYITWLLYKLHQLQKWLENGAKAKYALDNKGLWGHIDQQILTIQKKSNARKKNIRKLLKRSQRIITGLPYAAIVLNKNNEIDWANKISANYLNIDIKKDRGLQIKNLILVPEFQLALTEQTSTEIEFSPPQNTRQKLALQLIFIHKDLTLLIARDITDRENILQMRKNFIANASHELRTPLTVISGYLEIMQEDDEFPENLQIALVSAIDQSIRMQGIIEDLLILSRLENSTLDVKANTIINMPTLLKKLCEDEIRLITNKSHTLETQINPNLKIKGSEAEIISVCSNLIHNSIRHTQNGTQISVTWEQSPSGKACFTVKDNGQGIPAEHIPHLTERFYRVDKGRSRNQGGTGLGLAIVQHIIQRHDGRLEIQSIVGKGSSFSVFFPSDIAIEN